jgi:uncharacterized coiled-coil protein SlyX
MDHCAPKDTIPIHPKWQRIYMTDLEKRMADVDKRSAALEKRLTELEKTMEERKKLQTKAHNDLFDFVSTLVERVQALEKASKT